MGRPMTKHHACVVCTHCGGTGTVELTGVYAETLSLVIANPGKNGAALAALAGCQATAMNNRLTALERKGVIAGDRHGRQKLWRQKTT